MANKLVLKADQREPDTDDMVKNPFTPRRPRRRRLKKMATELKPGFDEPENYDDGFDLEPEDGSVDMPRIIRKLDKLGITLDVDTTAATFLDRLQEALRELLDDDDVRTDVPTVTMSLSETRDEAKLLVDRQQEEMPGMFAR